LGELTVEEDEFADFAAEEVVVGVADGGEFNGDEQSVAVTGEEGVDCGKGIGLGGLNQVGEGGE